MFVISEINYVSKYFSINTTLCATPEITFQWDLSPFKKICYHTGLHEPRVKI